jgi:type I restriction enzyme, S subunit
VTAMEGLVSRGWRTSTIGDIADVLGGKPAPQIPEAFSEYGIPFVRMRDLGRHHLTSDLRDVDGKISADYAAAHNLTPIKAGAILMPRSGSVALNHRAILGVDAIVVSHICAIQVTDPEVSNAYLYRYLCTVRLDNITKKTTGLDAINFSDLRKVAIPIPPIEEQYRIAAILEKADGIRQKREQVLNLTEDLLRSSFLEMFGDPATNPKKLPTAPIRTFGSIVTGNTPPRSNPDNYGDGIEWIKSDNINSPSHVLTAATERLSAIGERICRKASAGATLVTCIAGSPDCIGNAAMADRVVAFNQQINAIIPNQGTNPNFLYAQVLLAKKLIQRGSTNSMKGMVSKGKFQEIEFLAPSFAEQCQFGEIFQKILSTHSTIQAASACDGSLFSALSQRAFRGEL